MPDKLATADAKAAAVAARQHGVITTSQLFACGINREAASHRVRVGRFHRVHRGVYAVGHRGLGSEGRWLAAVLACGEGAVLSHISAAGLWELLPPVLAPVHVTVPTAAGRSRRPGVRIHRSPCLLLGATTIHHRIAVTTPARTLADLRRSIPPHEYRGARREAEYRGLDLGGLRTDGTRSEPEGHFLAFCRRHRIPAPETNAPVGRFTVDFLWPQQRLVVETDAWVSHRGSQAFEDDHERDLELRARGYHVRRFTHRQVRGSPQAVADALRKALGAGSSAYC